MKSFNNKKKPLFLKALVIIGVVFLISYFKGNGEVYAINTRLEGYKVGFTQRQIDHYSACLRVNKTFDSDIFVPTRTSLEWGVYRANPPFNASHANCPIPPPPPPPPPPTDQQSSTLPDCSACGYRSVPCCRYSTSNVVVRYNGNTCDYLGTSPSCPGGYPLCNSNCE